MALRSKSKSLGQAPAAPTYGVMEAGTPFIGAPASASQSQAARAVEEARQAGLLDGESRRHLSFRVPEALFEAAMRQSGVTSPTDLGVAALAIMAQPDPVAAYFKETFGRLGADFDLEY